MPKNSRWYASWPNGVSISTLWIPFSLIDRTGKIAGAE
jgi:hypothetical protein